MSFYQLSYIVFLAGIWLLAKMIRHRSGRIALLLLASYCFYYLLSPPFLTVLALSSLLNHGWSKLLRKHPDTWILLIGIVFNAGLLAFSKYSSVVLRALELTGWNGGGDFLIPIGVSFYTFQAIGYLIDVYRGYADEPNWIQFFLFMSFWPVILSGPICRLPEILPQLRQSSSGSQHDISIGFRRIVVGLFMKVVIADTLAVGLQPGQGITAGFDQVSGWSSLDVWILCIGYGFQIFFDFAGYSHIAIGTARLFGIVLRENFNDPFGSHSLSEFWNRWHMSLSSWIRDYLFFPLATVGRSRAWRSFALVVSMTVFGMWHGVGSTFVLWGLYHGVLLATHRQFQRRRQTSDLRPFPVWLAGLISRLVTYALVTLGWVLFRANDWGQAARMFESLASPGRATVLSEELYWLVIAVGFTHFSWLGAKELLGGFQSRPKLRQIAWWMRPIVLATMILMIVIWSDQSSPFVYVRF
jgi:D-alanyl-lipoteichoic acid acyltransferase DltB (MBOAT superfamily)